jgi:predicted sulfurtransferase
MNSRSRFAIASVTVLLALCGVSMAFGAADVPLMSKEELKALLDDPQVIILDVRQGRDWTASEFKIPGAVSAPPGDFNNWAGRYPKEKRIILYCA